MTDSERPLIEHVTVNVAHAPAAAGFYRAVLGALDSPRNVDEHGRESYGPNGDFGVYERQEQFYEASHVAFAATSPADVDRVCDAALEAGGRTVDGPRERPEFGPGVYSAYLLDPAGNTVEVIYRPR